MFLTLKYIFISCKNSKQILILVFIKYFFCFLFRNLFLVPIMLSTCIFNEKSSVAPTSICNTSTILLNL